MSGYFDSDIQKLNALYNRLQFSFVFLYGRYDTGKTRLVRDFCQGKKTLFYSAAETVPDQQLSLFWKESIRMLCPARQPAPFSDWKEAFSYISGTSFSHRLVLVLDEFQELMRHDPEFPEAFRWAVSHAFPSGKVFLIITSSSVEFASQAFSDPDFPHTEVTARALLTALPFYNCQPVFADYSPKEQLLLYGITGGLPGNLALLTGNASVSDLICQLFFQKNSPLFLLPQTWLHRELREVSTYNYLLGIIAAGHTKLVDIAQEASIGTNKCAKYLNVLIGIGILKKEFPAAGEILKKVRYVFTDHMLRFWYCFVYPNISAILFDDGRQIWEQQVLPKLDQYLIPVMEDVCSEYLKRLSDHGQTPFTYQNTGSWWSGGTKREPFFRIPLVAVDRDHAVLGVCHMAEQPLGLSVLTELQKPLEPFAGHTCYYCIFSASGFSRELQEAARKEPGIWLIDLEDITAL